MITWLKARCPVCGRSFEHMGKYIPKTCSDFECVQKYHFYPEKYQKLDNQLDECRKKAGV